MFSRMLCGTRFSGVALSLFSLSLASLAAPASATFLDIHEDFTLDYTIPKETDIRIYGDAKLTIDEDQFGAEPIITSKIFLYDTSSFELAGGQADKIYIHGSDNRLEFTGGRLRSAYIHGLSAGNTEVVFNGSQVWIQELKFFAGGTQTITVKDFTDFFEGTTDLGIRYSEGMTIDLQSPQPFYWCGPGGACYTGYWAGGLEQLYMPSGTPWTLNDSNPERLAGDIDNNGAVDLADLNLVRNSFGSVATSAGDTLPYDGKIDLTDLNRVRNSFGQGVGEQAVPEPSSALLMVLGFASLSGFLAKCRRPSRTRTGL